MIWAALSAVYIIWGTTYLAIRVSNETLPPLIAAGIRFLIAGAVLYAVVGAPRRRRRATARPATQLEGGRRSWASGSSRAATAWWSSPRGTVPSGIMSLIIALVPLWMALVDRVLLHHRVGGLTTLGLVLGFGGAALLIGGTAFDASAPLSGMLVGVVASLSGRAASLYSRNAPAAEAARSSVPGWR